MYQGPDGGDISLVDELRAMADEHGFKTDIKDCDVFAAAADRITELESKLDAIRLKCLDELKHDRRTAFEEGRMDFADVIWRMIVQEPKP